VGEWGSAGDYARLLAISWCAGVIGGPCLVAIPALGLQKMYLQFEVVRTCLRIAAVMVCAFFFKDALAVVMAFAIASVLINLAMIVVVLIEGQRWARRLPPDAHGEVTR